MGRKKLDTTSSSEIFDQRQLPDGRRKIKLRKGERAALNRRTRAETAATLFLDLETDRTWAEIAAEMEISPHQLRDITKTKEFDEAYSQLFAELGHDPRFRAAQGAIADLLPIAVRQLRTLLTSPRTPASILFKSIEKVMALNGLTNRPPAASDREELATFLAENDINISINQVNVPQEYLDQYAEVSDVIEGEARDVTDQPDELPPQT